MHLFNLKGLVVIEVLTAYPSFTIDLVKGITVSSISEMGRKKRRKKRLAPK